MGAPNLTLPEADKAWLDHHARERGFASADDYARYLVSEERATRWWAEQEADHQASIRTHIDEGWRQSDACEFVEAEAVIEELRSRSADLRSKQ